MGRHNEPNWQERCLMAIEYIAEYACIGIKRHQAGEKCFPCQVFRIAHVGTAECGHPQWDKEAEKIFGEARGE